MTMSDETRNVLRRWHQRQREEAGLPPSEKAWREVEAIVADAPVFTPAQRETIRAMLPPDPKQRKRAPRSVPGTTPSPRHSRAHRARSCQEPRDDDVA